jgi:hypothetical protein
VKKNARDEQGWEQYGEEEGIRLYRKKVEGSKFVAFRGDGIVDQPIFRVMSAMADASRRTEWVSDCTEAKQIATTSKVDKIDYNRTHAPWPIKDRDFVYRVTMEFNRDAGDALIALNSVEDSRMPPRDGIVRGTLHHSLYWLRSIEGGKKTWVRVEIHADPKGALPAWVVNLVQKKWPYVTVHGLRKESARAEVVVDPELQAYWERGVVPTWYKKVQP